MLKIKRVFCINILFYCRWGHWERPQQSNAVTPANIWEANNMAKWLQSRPHTDMQQLWDSCGEREPCRELVSNPGRGKRDLDTLQGLFCGAWPSPPGLGTAWLGQGTGCQLPVLQHHSIPDSSFGVSWHTLPLIWE